MHANVCEIQWEKEKEAIHSVADLKRDIRTLRRELEEAESKYDLNKAAEFRHGKIPSLEKQIAEVEAMQHDEAGQENRLLREEVTEEEIAEIVSRWTGIPVAKLVEGEREKLLRLKETLQKRVIGQDEAVDLVDRCSYSCTCWY